MADLSQMCSFVMMRVNAFLDDELDEETANEVREHLGACESCLDEVTTWTGLRMALKHAYEPGKCPTSVLDKVTAEIHLAEASLEN
ncbi:MAG: zf-HC2 domain-containing protein [Propionibacteriaceae bacterium]|jgi:anti-sigma factor (TIGR02949 family)|nr:zf-HC2 domain-containing protein [Propionibacteriaceae bacterium]